MNAVRVILALACWIWMTEPSHALQDPTRAQASAESASAADNPKARPKQESDEEPVHHHTLTNKQLRGSRMATPGIRFQQIPKRDATPDRGAANARSAALGEPGRAAREGFVQNEILNRSALPTRPPRVAPGGGVTANNPRHRSPNPAVVDGSMNARNTGAINGTHMVRKP